MTGTGTTHGKLSNSRRPDGEALRRASTIRILHANGHSPGDIAFALGLNIAEVQALLRRFASLGRTAQRQQ
jgi:hypothetical protein